MIMPFGKYVNKEVEEIFSDYLEWLMEEDWFLEKFEELAEEVEGELETRTKSYAHFYTDRRNE